ncbi:unnamed protein product [Urochloa decumbens]|uniref:CCHC-type domain-containing protein n=1 Tax=Urochloa decumbens TaxID=240449 RepID=A0ABC8XPK8_9POAL
MLCRPSPDQPLASNNRPKDDRESDLTIRGLASHSHVVMMGDERASERPAPAATPVTGAQSLATHHQPSTQLNHQPSTLHSHLPSTRRSPLKGTTCSPSQVDEQIRHFCSDGDAFTAGEKRETTLKKGKAVLREVNAVGGSRACGPRDPGPSNWGEMRDLPRPSYRDALVRPRTFRPRFPAASSAQDKQIWLHEERRNTRRGARSGDTVSRGRRLESKGGAPSVLDRLGADFSTHQPGESHLLTLLKAKAGIWRCFNCLASDHRISQCRDPPKCLICSRSGHKARICPRRLDIGASRRPAVLPTSPVPVPRRLKEEDRRMESYEFPPGDVTLRPPLVRAAVARTSEVRESARELELYTLVAVQRNCLMPVSCEDVLRDAPRQLRIPAHELEVEGLSQAKFLLRFGSSQIRNVALAAQSFQVGSYILSIMPWSPRIGATVGRLRYRARVCLEGVPRHARNAAAVAQLFSNPSFIDEVNCAVEKADARFCFNIWVWTDAPYDLALQGKLQVEQPLEYPDQHFTSMDSMDDQQPPVGRYEPLKTVDYDVLIHLDRVLDYTPNPVSPDRYSYESDVSGMPSQDYPTREYPERFDFTWFLGYKDGDRPTQRVSVHDRLGMRVDRPDRSPPRGGNGGGFGLRQWPPGTFHDASRAGGHGQGGFHGYKNNSTHGGYGGQRRDAGRGRQRQRAGHGAATRSVWREKKRNDGKSTATDEVEVLFNGAAAASKEDVEGKMDPMLEEVVCLSHSGPIQPMSSQRLVEPTVTEGVGLAPVSCEKGNANLQDHETVAAMKEPPLPDKDVLPARNDEATITETEVHAVCSQGNAVRSEIGDEIIELVGHATESDDENDAGVPISDLSTSPVMGIGLLFDLNEGPEEALAPIDHAMATDLGHHASRLVLTQADSRLNKEPTEVPTKKGQTKGIARFSVPLKKALLCLPAARLKPSHGKKTSDASTSTTAARKAAKPGRGGLIVGSVEEKASAMLLKTAGLLVQDEAPTEAAQHLFAQEFVKPARSELVGDMRLAFGLPDMGAGPLEVLAVDAAN